ncbi:acetylxylan esterase [Prosthecobacter sp.]|uniref:alpha/beta hydrolase family protein n=1 Tax=Prosthecobacter sp. TaxID=1965333 RepID=UPI002487FCE4|nr:acetylxylan esterase [Prosthecobacter sp.]MDI1314430.1 acetylxylan esterase [Prosthecobacter sp.]
MHCPSLTALILFGALCVALAAKAEVQMDEFLLKDAKRERQIECRSYAPKSGDKLPLIVFSHGFGADNTAFSPIAQHWAEHGYVVIAPSHLDGAGKSKGKGNPLPASGLPALMAQAVLKTENRVRDLTFILDALEQVEARVPSLRGRIDSGRVGFAGHSLGAYTAMLVGGVTADINDQKARSFRDPRVRCILPISGQGTGQQGLTASSWSALSIPMLTITGSLDRGAGGQGPEWKQQPFELSPPGDKYLVFIEGASHVAFGGARPGEITEAVKASTLAFWDAHLKNVPAAKASLKDGSILTPWKQTARISNK